VPWLELGLNGSIQTYIVGERSRSIMLLLMQHFTHAGYKLQVVGYVRLFSKRTSTPQLA